MGVFDNGVSGLVEDLGKSEDAARRESFNQNFDTGDFDYFGGDTLSGEYTEVAEYVVPAGTEVSWGYGRAANEANQGYVYADIRDDADEEIRPGKIRLVQRNPTGRRERVVAEFALDDVDNDRYDRSQQPPLPEQRDKPLVTQDSSIVVKILTDGTDTVDPDNSELRLPVSEYEV